MDTSLIRRYRWFLFVFFIIGMMGITAVYYYEMLQKIPSIIYIQAGQEEHISFEAPVQGEIFKEIVEVGSFEKTSAKSVSIPVNFNRELVFYTNRADEYSMKLRLFGIFPYKNVKVEAVEDRKVYPMGTQVGIYIKMDGILVIDTGSFANKNGVESAPAQGILDSGDYITCVNGKAIESKKDFVKAITDSEGEALHLVIKREDIEATRVVYPQQDAEGKWKIGVWIRDSIQGIGTLTYVEENGDFAALGHGVTDCDTNELVDIAYGNIYTTRIISIEKGESGEPGGITGVIEYTGDNIKGKIVDNTESGIKGIDAGTEIKEGIKSYGIGYKQDAMIGDAQILSAVDGERKLYDVKITDINYNYDNKKREIALEVTDENLLRLTGGIVQGMSGSPIIQNDKMIGAVTHVLVKNPQKGYGIFVENMLITR